MYIWHVRTLKSPVFASLPLVMICIADWNVDIQCAAFESAQSQIFTIKAITHGNDETLRDFICKLDR